ncbi:MAG TPA: hypothetical protein VH744_10160, partial [Terriglobales bacterium]
MRPKVRLLFVVNVMFAVLLVVPFAAWAHHCSSESDCWPNAQAAVGATLGISMVAAGAAWLGKAKSEKKTGDWFAVVADASEERPPLKGSVEKSDDLPDEEAPPAPKPKPPVAPLSFPRPSPEFPAAPTTAPMPQPKPPPAMPATPPPLPLPKAPVTPAATPLPTPKPPTMPVVPAPSPNPASRKPTEDQSGSDLGEKIKAWASGKIGEKFGDGSCYDLVDKALRSVGAKTAADFGRVTLTADYIWGTPIDLRDARPGDIIQFRDVKFVGKDGKWEAYGHHSAIVAANKANGQIVVLQQNVAIPGVKGDVVHERSLNFPHMTQG